MEKLTIQTVQTVKQILKDQKMHWLWINLMIIKCTNYSNERTTTIGVLSPCIHSSIHANSIDTVISQNFSRIQATMSTPTVN